MFKRHRSFPVSAFVAFCLLILWTLPALAIEAGRVVALVPGASVQRGGQTLPLEMQSAVEAGDTVVTDATGRVRILFTDDSSMTIGSNTVLELQEFVPGGSKPAQKTHLAKGILRTITGKIVEQNPEGFSLTSPEATVGIRGTDSVLTSENGVSTGYLLNSRNRFSVNGVYLSTGQKLTVPGGTGKPESITPEDRRKIAQALAFKGGLGVAAAAPEPSGEEDQGTPPTLVGEFALPTPGTALGEVSPLELNGASLASGAGGLPTGPLTATYWGATSILDPAFPSTTDFGFDVNLSSGAITNGHIQGFGATVGAFTATGGTGSVAGGNFTINGFSGVGISSSIQHGAGTFTPGDGSVIVDVIVQHPTVPANIDSGSGYIMTKQ